MPWRHCAEGLRSSAELVIWAQAVFVEKLKADFESLSLAIANLPVGLIPFPDRCVLAQSCQSMFCPYKLRATLKDSRLI